MVKMTSIEQTGKNVEEATKAALEQLGVTEDEVDVEILDEGSRGFLGLGQSPARVRVTLKATEQAANLEDERPPRARQADKTRTDRQKATAKPRRRETARQTPRRKPESQSLAAEPEQASAQISPETQVPLEASDESANLVADIGVEVLQSIIEKMGSSARVVVKSATPNQITLDLVGGETGMLVGRHGGTLNALQYLVGIIVSKRAGRHIRVILDAEGYRTRREETLTKQALYLAAKVKESGQEAVLEPLPANERRIIHLALAGNPDVTTYSEGEEPQRRVVITPKK